MFEFLTFPARTRQFLTLGLNFSLFTARKHEFLTNYNCQGLAAIAAIPPTLTKFLTNYNRQAYAAIAAIPLT
jgi:hypothetical protein